MKLQLGHISTPGGFGRSSGFLLRLLLYTTMAAIAPPAVASDSGDHSTVVHEQTQAADDRSEEGRPPKQDQGPEPTTSAAAPSLCEALATSAKTNDLPLDFFTRLIWQESRFKPDAISRKGAQGIAQFMATTSRLNDLENPFDPLQALAKSGNLLRDLLNEFGNLGLAAAAYNAGSGRVHDWLGRRRPLPQETRTYVRIITGRDVEQWAEGRTDPVEIPSVAGLPCDLPPTTSIKPGPDASPLAPETIKPWGVEVVGGPTPAKALARYREWQSKYVAIIADREPHVVIRGMLGEMGAARVRVGEDTQAGAKKLCAALRVAGTYCDVLRN